jgi:hypothetical protein
MSGARKLSVLALCALAVTAAGVTLAAFSGQTSNSGNSFSAAGSFGGGLRMASGTYGGDGVDDRAITGLGFQPDVVIVKGNAASEAFIRTSTFPAGESKRLVGGNTAELNQIQSFETDGFTIGSGTRVNTNGNTYYWTAFKADSGVLKVGSYTGNGTSQTIAGVGFSPEYVLVADDNNERAIEHFAGSANSYRFDADTGLNTRVTSLNADGFSVGSDNTANRSGRTFHYVAFNELPGSVKVGTYPGDGASPRSVTGVGFDPEYVNIRAAGNLTGQHRNIRLPGSESMYFQANTNQTTAIRALQTDGFQLGNHSTVNSNGTTYQYVAFDNAAGGCSQPTSGQTLIATNDSWVDEANPSANNGAATTLRVRSQTGSQNQRAFVDFNLPSLPTGCTVTNADFYMYATAPVAGRTVAVDRAATAWTENGVTWSNQPPTAGTPATATTTGAVGWFKWDIEPLVTDLYTSGNSGLRVADQTEDASPGVTQVYGSSESGGTPPVLLLSIGN